MQDFGSGDTSSNLVGGIVIVCCEVFIRFFAPFKTSGSPFRASHAIGRSLFEELFQDTGDAAGSILRRQHLVGERGSVRG